jgi:hypothetical protein
LSRTARGMRSNLIRIAADLKAGWRPRIAERVELVTTARRVVEEGHDPEIARVAAMCLRAFDQADRADLDQLRNPPIRRRR